MIKLSTIIIALFFTAVGAVAALYFYCPTLCKNAVHGGVAGLLHDKLGLSQSAADQIAGLFI